MAKNCSACSDLREYAPNFTQNGIGDTECNSLKNNTGLNPSNSPTHTNCADFEDVNDCLIGNMEDEIEAYDVCDWKDYTKSLVGNLYQVFKFIGCSLCGAWTKINNILKELANLKNQMDKQDCELDYLFEGFTFRFTEADAEDDVNQSYVVAGMGVSWAYRSDSDLHSSDLAIRYIAGGLLRVGGSLSIFKDDFKDAKSVLSFNSVGATKATRNATRNGNPVWGQDPGPMVGGGELLYEYRIKKSEYPQIRSLWSGFGQETGGGGYHIQCLAFDEGEYAYGQHGWCDEDGNPTVDGYSPGHKVKDGYFYVQIRMSYKWALSFAKDRESTAGAFSADYSPRGFMGIRMKRSALDC